MEHSLVAIRNRFAAEHLPESSWMPYYLGWLAAARYIENEIKASKQTSAASVSSVGSQIAAIEAGNIIPR